MQVNSYALLGIVAGWLAAVSDGSVILAILFERNRHELEARLSKEFPGAEEQSRGIAQTAVKQLQQYFAGERRTFDLPLSLQASSGFARKVLKALQQVPYGSTVTYKELAGMAGSPAAARAIGRVMASNPLPILIPCHRVIGSNGKLTGYSGGGGVTSKRCLLDLEQRQSSS